MTVEMLLKMLEQYDTCTGRVFVEINLTFSVVDKAIILETDNTQALFDTVQDLIDYLAQVNEYGTMHSTVREY